VAQDRAISEIEGVGVGQESVIVAKGDCHEGVIGIVAGRVVERYRRPSFVFAEAGEGLLRGSGRSFGEFALADCITHCQKMLVAGGGHDFACGVTIANSDFEEFKKEVNNFYNGLGLKNQERFLKALEDLVVEDIGELSEEFVEELSLLEPYGEGNPEPCFKLRGVLVLSVVKMGAEGKHLRLDVRGRDGKIMKLVAFFARDEWFEVEEGEKVDVLVNLEINEWNGARSVEGMILSVERTEEMW
jgi:single-stranded-DNA-specific exonuclease